MPFNRQHTSSCRPLTKNAGQHLTVCGGLVSSSNHNFKVLGGEQGRRQVVDSELPQQVTQTDRRPLIYSKRHETPSTLPVFKTTTHRLSPPRGRGLSPSRCAVQDCAEVQADEDDCMSPERMGLGMDAASQIRSLCRVPQISELKESQRVQTSPKYTSLKLWSRVSRVKTSIHKLLGGSAVSSQNRGAKAAVFVWRQT